MDISRMSGDVLWYEGCTLLLNDEELAFTDAVSESGRDWLMDTTAYEHCLILLLYS